MLTAEADRVWRILQQTEMAHCLCLTDLNTIIMPGMLAVSATPGCAAICMHAIDALLQERSCRNCTHTPGMCHLTSTMQADVHLALLVTCGKYTSITESAAPHQAFKP